MRRIGERLDAAKQVKSSGLTIDGHQVALSRLDKVFYPSAGFTKGQIVDYYIRISAVLLPHLKGRALTMKRYPDGVNGMFFYEKRCPSYRPKWVKTVGVWSEGNQENISYCLANDLASLIWMVNLADLELHTSLALGKKPNQPTAMVFDLDPGPPADIVQCAQVGLWLRDVFDKHGLESFPKTSGSKGLQVYVPLNTKVTFEATKQCAREIAAQLRADHPDSVTDNMAKKLRKGKVFIDWSQNDAHKTTVCVYSLRAKERPTVSAPVTWREVEKAARKTQILSFETDEVIKRATKLGDLFAPVLKLKQRLPK